MDLEGFLLNKCLHMLFTKNTKRSVFVVRAINYKIQAFMAKLNCFGTHFCSRGKGGGGVYSLIRA